MTTANGSTHPSNERKPFVSGWLKQVQVKPLAIILAAAAVLIVSSCARLGGTFQNHDTPSTLATVGLFAGVAAIPLAIVWAIVALILKLVRKRGAQA